MGEEALEARDVFVEWRVSDAIWLEGDWLEVMYAPLHSAFSIDN